MEEERGRVEEEWRMSEGEVEEGGERVEEEWRRREE